MFLECLTTAVGVGSSLMTACVCDGVTDCSKVAARRDIGPKRLMMKFSSFHSAHIFYQNKKSAMLKSCKNCAKNSFRN